ncbi:hypothetical protein DMENIID0001_028830 [Sergentomyia squamirostris]
MNRDSVLPVSWTVQGAHSLKYKYVLRATAPHCLSHSHKYQTTTLSFGVILQRPPCCCCYFLVTQREDSAPSRTPYGLCNIQRRWYFQDEGFLLRADGKMLFCHTKFLVTLPMYFTIS